MRLINEVPELAEARQTGLKVKAARAESNMFKASDVANNPTAADKILKAYGPEEWRDKSTVNIRQVGFSVPKDKDMQDEATIISIVNGGRK